MKKEEIAGALNQVGLQIDDLNKRGQPTINVYLERAVPLFNALQLAEINESLKKIASNTGTPQLLR